MLILLVFAVYLSCRADSGRVLVEGSAISATIQVEDDGSTVVAEMLRQFPKVSRVQLAIS
jgi:hypothetical protein